MHNTFLFDCFHQISDHYILQSIIGIVSSMKSIWTVVLYCYYKSCSASHTHLRWWSRLLTLHTTLPVSLHTLYSPVIIVYSGPFKTPFFSAGNGIIQDSYISSYDEVTVNYYAHPRYRLMPAYWPDIYRHHSLLPYIIKADFIYRVDNAIHLCPLSFGWFFVSQLPCCELTLSNRLCRYVYYMFRSCFHPLVSFASWSSPRTYN